MGRGALQTHKEKKKAACFPLQPQTNWQSNQVCLDLRLNGLCAAQHDVHECPQRHQDCTVVFFFGTSIRCPNSCTYECCSTPGRGAEQLGLLTLDPVLALLNHPHDVLVVNLILLHITRGLLYHGTNSFL